MKPERDDRRRGWVLPVLLLLLVSHGLVYLLAKRTAHAAAVAETQAAEGGWSLPGKSAEREAGGTMKPAGFRRVLADLERPGSGYSAVEFQMLRKELFREWIRRDLRSAMDCLYGPVTGARYPGVRNELYVELGEEFARQPREVMDSITLRRFGSKTGEVASHWVNALLVRGETELVMEGLPHLPASVFDECFAAMAKKASAAQLEKMRGIAGDMGQSRVISDVPDSYGAVDERMSAYVLRKVQLANGDVSGLLEGEENPEVIRELVLSWVDREAAHLPAEAAVDAVLQLPAEHQAGAVEALLREEHRGGFAGMAALLDEVDTRGLIGAEDPEGARSGMVENALRSLMDDNSRLDPDAVLRQAQVIRNDELRHEVMRRFWKTLGNSELLQALVEQVPGLPPGPDLDALLSGPAADRTYDPELREKLLAAIGDAALVEKIRGELEESAE